LNMSFKPSMFGASCDWVAQRSAGMVAIVRLLLCSGLIDHPGSGVWIFSCRLFDC
jgi:hypothetical protein